MKKVTLGVTYITLNADKDKVSFPPGAVVELDDRRADKMIAAGDAALYEAPVAAPVVIAAAKPAKPAKPPKSDLDPVRIEGIAKAIAGLDPKMPDHYGKNGRPLDAAVEAAFGDKVSAAEIDAALASIKVAGAK